MSDHVVTHTHEDPAFHDDCSACVERRAGVFRTTGALPVGLDDAPRGYTDGCQKSGMSPEGSYIKPALGLGASGMAFSLDDARDRIERRDATIAEQAAEIERLKHDIDALKFDTGTLTTERDTLRASVDYLKGERDTLRSALEIAGRRSDSQNASIAYFEQESASHDAALAEVTTDRDTLRLEVQRLKDLNFEAQDRYAALEAERDEARRASETVHSHYVLALKQRDEAVANTRAECDKGYEALFQAHQRMVAERDELKTKVDELTNTTWKLRSEGVEERARAESYLRVIEAKDAEILAALRLRSATIRTIAAMSAASLEFREVDADEKEADHE